MMAIKLRLVNVMLQKLNLAFIMVCKVAHETLLILLIGYHTDDLIVSTNISVPEMLKVNEGFHHDLNAIASEELRGPTFPC